VDIGIGATLRKARNRRKVELSEVEAATKIRTRFLRAIEDEDWDTLPGDVYARSFIRTYAGYLGLDGQRLAEEFGSRGPPEGEGGPSVSGEPVRPARSRPAVRSQARRRLGAAAIVAGLAGLAVAIGLATGGEDSTLSVEGSRTGTASGRVVLPPAPPEPRPAGLSLELTASDEVWVCLLDSRERPLVNGLILEAGAEEGPFRSGSFTVSFGNGEIAMRIDGQEAEIPETSSPIGYKIGDDGSLEQLAEGERPTCT
jgi:hypothetical protein